MTKTAAYAIGCVGLMLSMASTGADNADIERLANSCQEQTNMGKALCACVAEKAAKELSSGGFRFLLASVEGDDATAASLRAQLPVPEMMQAGTFLSRAPAQCAQQHGADQ